MTPQSGATGAKENHDIETVPEGKTPVISAGSTDWIRLPVSWFLNNRCAMGKVIKLFRRERKKKNDSDRGSADRRDHDFTGLLKQAVSDARVCGDQAPDTGEEIALLDEKAVDFFRKRIHYILIKEKILEPDLFRCTLHISQVMADMVHDVPASYFASDYLVASQEDTRQLLRGGDLCCMICIFFKEWANRRAMRLADYEQMGMQLYLRHYAATRRSIGHCMAHHFRDVVAISRECLQDM